MSKLVGQKKQYMRVKVFDCACLYIVSARFKDAPIDHNMN